MSEDVSRVIGPGAGNLDSGAFDASGPKLSLADLHHVKTPECQNPLCFGSSQSLPGPRPVDARRRRHLLRGERRRSGWPGLHTAVGRADNRCSPS